jgi:hypothetical protein
MIARILCTCAALLLAGVAFLGYGPAPAGVNSPGVILCIGAAFVWFGWSAGYSYRREASGPARKRPDLITIGGGPLLKQEANDPASGEPQ